MRTCVSRWTRPLLARHASSTSPNPFPYPGHANPSPHQIFHLPPSASLQDVKARYYDLVRIYHPDSPLNRALPPATVQARFQSISAAYDVLRGRSRLLPSGETEPVDRKKDHHDLSSAMWKAKQRKKAELAFAAPLISDKWKDRLMLGAIFFTIGAFVAQTYSTRQQALSAASKDYAHARSDYYGPKRTRRVPSHNDSELAALDGDRTSDKPP
ncbi:hypothetical protein BXZ70DRAFT_315658 [Cristinia sonorae]|uniref:J domain-containing protein n=1 Tax=Cristinia sonorae TaxID=1940300 RepID=A0A8K0ULI7_9AGAR|nr:hypothetical protein BXZ70DRAFT_315658 [Cristinia sonorae]